MNENESFVDEEIFQILLDFQVKEKKLMSLCNLRIIYLTFPELAYPCKAS